MYRIVKAAVVLLACSIPSTTARLLADEGLERDEPGEVVTAIPKDTWIVHQSVHGDYWFGSHSEGAFRYDGKTITRFTTKDGLAGDHVRRFQEDDAGILYVETSGNAIARFDGSRFSVIRPVASTEWRLDPRDLWFLGDLDAAYRFDGKTLHRLELPKHPLDDTDRSDERRRGWTAYDVYTIYRDKRGSLWFGTAALGACRYDGKTWQWLYEDHLTIAPNGGSFGIRSILEDKDSKFWICNSKYRFAIAPSGASERGPDFIRYERETGIADLPASWGDDRIYFQAIVESDDGALWMSPYGGGIWRFDGKEAINYPVLDDGAPTQIFAIYQDRRGGLWLGTPEAGAYRFDGKAFVKFVP